MYRYTVITCNFDNYEIMREVINPLPDVEYLYVTNTKDIKSNSWNVIYDEYYNSIENSFDKVVEFRHKVLEYCNSDICVRIDGSIQIQGNAFEKTIEEFSKDNYDISFIIHPYFNTVRQEYNDWHNIRGVSETETNASINYLSSKGLNIDNVTICTLTILIQRKNEINKDINDFQYNTLCELKNLNNISHFDRNDQGIFTYTLNSVGGCKILFLHYSILERNESRLFAHNRNDMLIVQYVATMTKYFSFKGNIGNMLFNGNKWLKTLTSEEILKRAKKILLRTPVYVLRGNDRLGYNDVVKTYEDIEKNDFDLTIIGNSNEEDYYTDEYNTHHLKCEWHYEKLLPIITSLLKLTFNKDDFKTVTENAVTTIIPKVTQNYDIYCPTLESKPDYIYVYYDLSNYHKETSDSICFPTERKKGFYQCTDSYHNIFKYHHRCCKIVNLSNNNNKKLLLIGNSHSIPYINILAYYYSEVVVIDNRLSNFSFDFLYQYTDFDDILMLMSYNTPYEYYCTCSEK